MIGLWLPTAPLIDWRGTLVHIPRPTWLVARALESIGRPAESDVVDAVVDRLAAMIRTPEFAEAERRIDSSAGIHRPTSMLMLERAGLEPEVADALYRVEWEPESRPVYPDVPEMLGRVRELGVKIAVVSNIHFDIRPDFAQQGIHGLIDAYVLSFEHGCQKPDARIFRLALGALRVEAEEAVMVGDSAETDGGAAAVGITTLILPRLDQLLPRGLDVVLQLLT
jgi:HAD superfamily hydrolase (TIGR01509 family)